MSLPHYDVFILGGGLAGLSTAIMLKQKWGVESLVVDRTNRRDRVGDSLSPSAKYVLRQLGIWDIFLGDHHRPCYGHRSSWGHPQLHFMDYMNHPDGHGWNIDRVLLEKRLRELASQLGIPLLQDMAVDIQEEMTASESYWKISGKEWTGTSRFIVDATGSGAAFARKRGIRRVLEDAQIGVYTYYLGGQSTHHAESFSLVEAVENGWWYSTRLPEDKHLVLLMTDPKVESVAKLEEMKYFGEKLQLTSYTKERILRANGKMLHAPRFVVCNSGRLEAFYGRNWLAVGDAAMTLDPIAAHGMTNALVGGRDAAEAIALYLRSNGDEAPLQVYASRLQEAYSYYASMRGQLYHQVRQWQDATYWKRRRESVLDFSIHQRGK